MNNANYYQEFIDFVQPVNNDIDGALRKILFPDDIKTRQSLHYRYVIVPLLLDLLEHFFPVDGVIDANSLFYKILDNIDISCSGILDDDIAEQFTGLLIGFVVLATNDEFLSADSILELIETRFPALSDCLALDVDGPRKPVPDYLNFQRFTFNLKFLTVSMIPQMIF